MSGDCKTEIRAAVVGATGYTGAETLRLLLGHPRVRVMSVVGHGKAGQSIKTVLPSFAGMIDGDVQGFDAERIASEANVAFLGLPHGASAEAAKELRGRGCVVLDLSADFRLKDPAVYREWYGEHHAPELLVGAVYGLVELHREELRKADLIAVPGCYPTATVLALAPLLAERLIDPQGIVVDAKSGISGAGRSPLVSTHLPETAEGIRAYKTAGSHRHTPEIEQELSRAAGAAVRILFTPHLVPMTRGILSTCYATAASESMTAEQCTVSARTLYARSPFVVVMDTGSNPDTLWVRGSNRVYLSYARDARTGRVLAQSVIDNLVKGAAGQAVQCMNVRFGFDEAEGLRSSAIWP